jgi:mono/diheme cytochrome c family protein
MRWPEVGRTLVALVTLSLTAGAAAAQEPQTGRPSVGFGRPITEPAIAPWNIDIRTSDGKGLPPGRGSAAEGQKVYQTKCFACHGDKAAGGPMYGTRWAGSTRSRPTGGS